MAINALDHEIAVKKQNLKNLRKHISALKREDKQHHKQQMVKTKEINSLKIKIADTRHELEALRLDNELKSQRIDQKQSAKLQQIQNEIDVKQQRLKHLTADCRQKKGHLKSVHSDIERNTKRLNSVKTKMKKAEFKMLKITEKSKNQKIQEVPNVKSREVPQVPNQRRKSKNPPPPPPRRLIPPPPPPPIKINDDDLINQSKTDLNSCIFSKCPPIKKYQNESNLPSPLNSEKNVFPNLKVDSGRRAMLQSIRGGISLKKKESKSSKNKIPNLVAMVPRDPSKSAIRESILRRVRAGVILEACRTPEEEEEEKREFEEMSSPWDQLRRSMVARRGNVADSVSVSLSVDDAEWLD